MSVLDAAVAAAARGICQEQCAFMGEPPCWLLTENDGSPYPWPPPSCDDPGCAPKAKAAIAALRAEGWSVVKVPDAKRGDDDLSAYSQGREAGWNACRAAVLASQDETL